MPFNVAARIAYVSIGYGLRISADKDYSSTWSIGLSTAGLVTSISMSLLEGMYTCSNSSLDSETPLDCLASRRHAKDTKALTSFIVAMPDI